MTEALTIETRGAFAQRCNVTPSRVSHWVRDGKISTRSLDGEGRGSRIIVEYALADLRQTLDISQRLGNGLGTHLGGGPVVSPPSAVGPAPVPTQGGGAADGVDDQIKAAKLRDIEGRNADRERQRAVEEGRLIPAEKLQAAVTTAVVEIVNAIDQAAPGVSQTIAAQLGTEQRETRLAVQAALRALRANLSAQLAKRAEAHPPLDVTGADTDASNHMDADALECAVNGEGPQ